MEQDWTSVRLSRPTVDRLKTIRERMVRAARMRPRKANPKLLEAQVGLGDVINELAYLYERDAARQRYYVRRHRQAAAQENGPALPMPLPEDVVRFLDEGCPND